MVKSRNVKSIWKYGNIFQPETDISHAKSSEIYIYPLLPTDNPQGCSWRTNIWDFDINCGQLMHNQPCKLD